MRQEPVTIKHVIPAAPGYYALSLLLDENGKVEGARKEPIVGWAIDQYHYVCAVTPDCVEVDSPATLLPDGTVQDLTGSWESLDHWLAERKAARA